MDTIFLIHYSLNIPSPQSFFSLAFLNCKIRRLMRFHNVNDELIIECSKDVSLDAICEQMGRTPSWANGLVM